MDPERLKWITSPPTLDRWEIGCRYASTPSGLIGTVTMMGYCDRKRGALWTYSESHVVDARDYSLSDAIHHLVLVCNQVRPVTYESLQRGLVGGYWEQGELPF